MGGADMMYKSAWRLHELLKTAQSADHNADYVLFDTLFSSPAQFIAVKGLGLDSIAMIKKSLCIYYEYKGERLSLNKIFGICKKRRGCSKYLLSVNVMVDKDRKIQQRLFVCTTRRTRRTGSPLSAPIRLFLKRISSVYMEKDGK